MSTAFAFIDLLGFSEYVNADIDGAAQLLESQRHILQVKLGDDRWYKAKQSEVSDLGRDHLVTSFKHFLPFSDCLFVASDTPDLFVRQLAHFLLEAFTFTGHTYTQPEDPKDPTRVDMRVIGRAGVTTEHRHWYPVLWRGGLDFGRVELLDTAALKQNQPFSVPLLLGPAVVNAVRLEKTAKGPRLFCLPEFKTNLTDAALRSYFIEVPEKKGIEEFLWPAFLFNDRTRPLQELSRLHELLLPAVNLWRAAPVPEAKVHYLEFIRLLGRSARAWAEQNGVAEEGRLYLQQLVAAFKLDDLPVGILV